MRKRLLFPGSHHQFSILLIYHQFYRQTVHTYDNFYFFLRLRVWLSFPFFFSIFWLIDSFFYRSKPRHRSFDISPSLCTINTTTFFLLTFGSRGSVKFLSFKALNLDFLSSGSSIFVVSSLEIDCFSGLYLVNLKIWPSGVFVLIAKIIALMIVNILLSLQFEKVELLLSGLVL